MTREEAIKIAQELLPGILDAITSHTHLIVSDALLAAYERGRADEREACLRDAERFTAAFDVGEAIRARKP